MYGAAVLIGARLAEPVLVHPLGRGAVAAVAAGLEPGVARVARPFGRVIPLHSGRPCSCYPGLADGQGCSAALRFNPAPKEN